MAIKTRTAVTCDATTPVLANDPAAGIVDRDGVFGYDMKITNRGSVPLRVGDNTITASSGELLAVGEYITATPKPGDLVYVIATTGTGSFDLFATGL